jgi:hypothetical protein
MLANAMLVSDFDLGNLSTHIVVNFIPELPGIRLWFGDRRPVIGYMLILTSDLAIIAAVANIVINN